MMGGSRSIIERGGVAIAVLVIRVYQVLVAPLLLGGCRHHPTCSAYAIDALHRHGLRHGSLLAARRIWRCRPGGSYGYDPVPETISDSRNGKRPAR